MNEDRLPLLALIILPIIGALVGNAIWGPPDGGAAGVGATLLGAGAIAGIWAAIKSRFP